MTEKDKKIIADAERDGIPIFVFTAKDSLALDQIINYRDDCADYCTSEHYHGIEKRIDDFVEWQDNNVSKVKLPD